jgi:hypothetical protein
MDDLLLPMSGASAAGKTSERDVIAPDRGLEKCGCATASRRVRGLADRSSLSIGDTSHIVLQWIRDATARRAPVFHRDLR